MRFAAFKGLAAVRKCPLKRRGLVFGFVFTLDALSLTVWELLRIRLLVVFSSATSFSKLKTYHSGRSAAVNSTIW